MIDYREDNRWSVYVHIVPKSISGYENDKYYVGITSRIPSERWGRDGKCYSRQIFGKAISKYGWDNIIHEVIARKLTKEEAEKMEQKLISELNSHMFGCGYNMTMGGLGILPNELSTKRRRERMSGEGNYWYGKTHTEHTKELISLNHHDCSGGNNSQAKIIYQFSLDGEFLKEYPSSKEAHEETNTNRNGISKACLGNRIANGFLWAYQDNIIIENNIIKRKEKDYVTKKLTSKEVYAFTSSGEYINKYESCVIASKEFEGFSKDGISQCARNSGKYKGIKWRYKEDIIEVNNTFKIKDI